MTLPVTVSSRAAKRIATILANEGQGAMLRLAVTGGGCSGFQYNFTIDDTKMDDDLVVARDGATVLVDPDWSAIRLGDEVESAGARKVFQKGEYRVYRVKASTESTARIAVSGN